MMDWTSGTGSSADDVTVPEVHWDMMTSCSPEVHQYTMNGSPREQFMTHPSPDPLPVLLSDGTKPEVASFDFRWSAAATTEWTNAADQSTGSTADDVTVPEVLRSWYATADNPPHPVSGSWSYAGSNPSPDPAGTESGSGVACGGALCLQPAPRGSESDQWLDGCWTTHERNSCWAVDSSHVGGKQAKYMDSFTDQSLGGVIYESLEGASDVEYNCPLMFDDDYFDDVLSVMAKAAANSVPIHAVA